jgi:hypothetical protein
MCVTCLFEDHDVSLPSTKHVALRTNYSTEITSHKQSIQHNQTNKQLKWVCLTIWIIQDVRIERFGWGSWIWELVGKDQYD